MSSDKVVDYLTKQLAVERNLVTFRSLSRALSLHVNDAKNELARFHASSSTGADTPHATYLVSGEPHVSSTEKPADADEMDVDDKDEDDGDYVPETKIALVAEDDLEDVKAQYRRIWSLHIYSLSPSPIREPALLCEPTRALRVINTQQPELPLVVGRITGPHVTLRTKSKDTAKRPAAASSSKSKLPGLAKPAPSAKDSKSASKTGEVEPKEKPKRAGTLDFSKAGKAPEKAKPAVKVEEKPTKPEVKRGGKRKSSALDVEEDEDERLPSPPPTKSETKPKRTALDFSNAGKAPEKAKPVVKAEEDSDAKPSTSKAGAAMKDEVKATKRGVKRKSALDVEENEEEKSPPPVPPKPKPSARVKKGVIISDDEDEDEKPSRRPAGKTKMNPKAEKELRAIMDIDDEQVTMVTRQPSEVDPDTDGDVEMAVDEEDIQSAPEPAPIAKPKRKVKKEIPVGRNGLKKKRVMKSRSTMDDKGYFVTEDYSSYESVDEEEREPPKAAKGKKPPAAAKKVEGGPPQEEKKVPQKLQVRNSMSGTGAAKAKKATAPAKAKATLNNYFTKK
ncbi:hypothetical protein FA95DRAFT_1377918 [Auriscalpium vulgare]|uniref:Uncharacterized protein n=1 Tax=Auriscalpium vulgare TaxID=40419 RepID=A0ACB8S7V7_9AGAM|nr:hypothetical protein FA95DRAFT_1377918 [Auriscalpium vulgare]